MTAGDMVVNLTANSRGFASGMRSARSELSGFQAAVGQVKVALAGFLTFQAIKTGIGTIIDTIGKLDDTADLASRLGVSTEFLSEMQGAAMLADTDVEALNNGLKKLEKNLGKASIEGGELQKMLARVGLDATELAALGPEEAFLQIADAVKSIENPMHRAAFVTDVFGKSAVNLVNLLAEGREGIKGLRSEVRGLGGGLGEFDAAAVGEADRALKSMAIAWEGMKRDVAVTFAPVVVELTKAVRDHLLPAIREAGEVMKRLFPKDNVIQLKPPDDGPKIDLAAGAGDAVHDRIDMGFKDMKAMSKPIEVMSKEGFSILARALQKPSAAQNVAQNQLKEAQKANKHLGNIEDALKNQPQVAPAF